LRLLGAAQQKAQHVDC